VLDIVKKIWASLSKLFAPPSVISWLQDCLHSIGISFFAYRGSVVHCGDGTAYKLNMNRC